MLFQQAGRQVRDMPPVGHPHLRVSKMLEQGFQRIWLIQNGILRQKDQILGLMAQFCCQLACAAVVKMVWVKGVNLQPRLQCQLRGVIAGKGIHHQIAPGLDGLPLYSGNPACPLRTGIAGQNDDCHIWAVEDCYHYFLS